MTLTLEIPIEAHSWLEVAAQEHGQPTDDYIRESFCIWLSLSAPETEEEAFQAARALSLPTLEELWINEHDAIYDTL
ncbi:MAG: hypothetical protein ACRYFS_15705 [Janthinobacterium lividum]